MTKLLVDPETDTRAGLRHRRPRRRRADRRGVLAIEMGATARDLAETIHPHPTLGETVAFSAENYFGMATEIYRPRSDATRRRRPAPGDERWASRAGDPSERGCGAFPDGKRACGRRQSAFTPPGTAGIMGKVRAFYRSTPWPAPTPTSPDSDDCRGCRRLGVVARGRPCPDVDRPDERQRLRAAGTGRRRFGRRFRPDRDPGVARFAAVRDQQPRRRPGRLPAARHRAGGLPAGRGDSVLRHHALHQHDSRRRAAALPRQPRDRTAHQEHHPLERHGDGRPRQPRRQEHRRPHLDLRLVGDARRGGDQPLLPRPRRRLRRRPGLLPGPRLAGHLRPGLPRGPAHREAAGELPPRAGRRRRAVELSASVADAGLLGVPHGVDGPRADHGHLPGALQPLPAGPRHQGHEPAAVWASSATARPTSPRRSARSRWPRARSSTTSSS